MPAAGATAKLPAPLSRAEPPVSLDRHEPASSPGHDPVRAAKLRPIGPMTAAWAAQDAELDAEIAALEAVGARTVPGEEEQLGSALDPDSAVPHGLRPWPADLSGLPIDECLAVPVDATGPNVSRTGCRDRAGGAAIGFAAGGDADLLSPGAALAGLTEDAHAAGLSRLTDDELAGVIRAGRRLSSWASALELAAVSDLMRRREQQEAAGHLHAVEHADAEIAALLTLTGRGAGRVLDLAIALRRLPLTARALEAGVIDLPRMAVIADETTGLDDDHLAAVEQHILVRAPGQTNSQVRAAVRRAVLTADRRAARKRQEQAQREARVERWDEHAGTAALAGRDLPPAAVIAADQHISALARGLRAAGLAGNADQIRAQVFLALLSGIPAAALLPTGQQRPDSAANGSGTQADPAANGSGTQADPAMPSQPPKRGDPDMPGRPGVPGPPSAPGRPDVPGQPGMSGNPGTADSPVTRGGPHGAARSTPAAADRPGNPAGADRPGTPTTANWPGSPTNAGWPGNPPNAGWAGNPAKAGWPGSPASAGWGGNPASAGWRGNPASAGWRGIPAVAGTVNLTMPLSTWLGLSPVAHGCTRPGCGPPGAPPGACAPSPQGPAPPSAGPAPPEQRPTPPEHGSAPPEQRPTPPEHGSAPPEHRPASPDHRPAPPEHRPASPDHRPAPPEHGPASPEHGPASPEHGPASPEREAHVAAWLAGIDMKWFESDGCAHQRQSAAYRPPPMLQHLIRVRQRTCAFPGCRRPASQCDLDHTTPFQCGGLTCECNLAPLCRAHHKAKQAPGWHLTQDQPGVMTWRLPSGRTYQTAGDAYPV